MCDGGREGKSCPTAPSIQHELWCRPRALSAIAEHPTNERAPHLTNFPTKLLPSTPQVDENLAAQFAQSSTVCSVAFSSFSFL